jgi:hypothetical protein
MRDVGKGDKFTVRLHIQNSHSRMLHHDKRQRENAVVIVCLGCVGPEVNIGQEKGRSCDTRSLQPRGGPHKFHYMLD